MRHLKQSFFFFFASLTQQRHYCEMQIVENYKDVSFRFAKMNTDNFILLYVH